MLEARAVVRRRVCVVDVDVTGVIGRYLHGNTGSYLAYRSPVEQPRHADCCSMHRPMDASGGT